MLVKLKVLTKEKLGNLVSIQTGKLNSNASTENGVYPFFTCSREVFKTDTYSFDCECVLLAGNNAAGIYPLHFFQGKFDAYQRTYVIQTLDKTKIINRYLFYLLQPKLDHLKSISTGAATKFLTLTILKDLELEIPPLPVQRKIAAILSAYDDLIENNLRRIKILEEMAQNLYREWFVKFHFPGHQNARFVDSPLGRIPEGWEVVPMEEVCSRITDGSHRSPKTTAAGYPMASVKDMHDWGITLETCRKISEEEFRDLRRNDCIMRQGDVLIAKDGSYLKHCFVVEKDADVALLSSIAILRPNARIRGNILSRTLLEPHIKERMKGYVSGAALPRIILKEFRRFQIVLPPTIIQEQWTLLAEPMIKLCWRLNDKNTALRRTRDLLLPRLISGAVDVSELDISVPEAAA